MLHPCLFGPVVAEDDHPLAQPQLGRVPDVRDRGPFGRLAADQRVDPLFHHIPHRHQLVAQPQRPAADQHRKVFRLLIGVADHLDGIHPQLLLKEVGEPAQRRCRDVVMPHRLVLPEEAFPAHLLNPPLVDQVGLVEMHPVVGTVDGDAEEGEEVPGWLLNPDPDPNPPHPHPPKPVDIVPGDKTKVQQPKVIGIEKFVFYSPNRKEGKYTLSIVPAESGENGIIELQIAGEVYSFPATIKSATKSGAALTVEENRIKGIQFEKGKQLRISVELACKDYCALEVSAYAD